MHRHAMNTALAALHAQLACLAPESRFRLAVALRGGERCVTELAAMVELSQSCTTRHLQCLERAGLVRGARAGKKVLFRLEPAAGGVLTLIEAASGTASPAPIAVTPSTAAPRSAARGRRRPRQRSERDSADREAVRPLTPESDTPPAPAVSPRAPRSNDLEDFLL